VFTEILSVPNQYLVCVTAVDHDALYTIHPISFIQQLEERKLQIKVISGLGNNLLGRFCGKYGQNLQTIISRLKEDCKDDRITVEINFNNNEVVLFATEQNMEKVFCVVNNALECEGKMLRNECLERSLFPGRSGSSPVALFGSGAEIKHLELEKRYLTVEILHQNAHDINDKELICLVESIVSGVVNFHKSTGNFRMASDGTKWGKFTFLKPENAEDAVSKLNGIEFHGSSLKVLPVCSFDNRGLPFPAVRAKLCWPRKQSSGRAIVTCARGEAEFVVNDCFALGIGGRYVNCRVCTKYENCVFVEGVPMHVTEPELYDAIRSTTTRIILNVRLLRVKGSAIASPSVSTCEEELVKEISPFMPNKNCPGQNFRVEVFPPEENDSMIRATIAFDGSLYQEAARALDHLEGSFLPCCQPWQIIQCMHVFHSTLSCPLRVYGVISQEVTSLLESFQSQKGMPAFLIAYLFRSFLLFLNDMSHFGYFFILPFFMR
jgi:ATP-dependent RNA helicase DHX8/PRP22